MSYEFENMQLNKTLVPQIQQSKVHHFELLAVLASAAIKYSAGSLSEHKCFKLLSKSQQT